MEQRDVFSNRDRATPSLNRTWLIARFAPADGDERERGDHDLNPGLEPRSAAVPAAVLVPIVDHVDRLTVLFTQRTGHLAHHAGQISFPGGKIEAGDASPMEAALREAEEEIGLVRRRITILGALEDYVTRTGFRVHPVVGLVDPPLALRLDGFEVESVFEVPLALVLEPGRLRPHRRLVSGTVRHYYALSYGGHFIWGATAGMLVSLVRRLTQP